MGEVGFQQRDPVEELPREDIKTVRNELCKYCTHVVFRKSRENGLITKEHLVMHTH